MSRKFTIKAGTYNIGDIMDAGKRRDHINELKYTRSRLSDIINLIEDRSDEVYDLIDGDILIDDLRDACMRIDNELESNT